MNLKDLKVTRDEADFLAGATLSYWASGDFKGTIELIEYDDEIPLETKLRYEFLIVTYEDTMASIAASLESHVTDVLFENINNQEA